jgi:hypothetical protein
MPTMINLFKKWEYMEQVYLQVSFWTELTNWGTLKDSVS